MFKQILIIIAILFLSPSSIVIALDGLKGFLDKREFEIEYIVVAKFLEFEKFDQNTITSLKDFRFSGLGFRKFRIDRLLYSRQTNFISDENGIFYANFSEEKSFCGNKDLKYILFLGLRRSFVLKKRFLIYIISNPFKYDQISVGIIMKRFYGFADFSNEKVHLQAEVMSARSIIDRLQSKFNSAVETHRKLNKNSNKSEYINIPNLRKVVRPLFISNNKVLLVEIELNIMLSKFIPIKTISHLYSPFVINHYLDSVTKGPTSPCFIDDIRLKNSFFQEISINVFYFKKVLVSEYISYLGNCQVVLRIFSKCDTIPVGEKIRKN